MARVAITGGTGFVGRHLVRALLDAGHEVVILARGHRRAVASQPGVRFHPTDLTDFWSILDALEGCRAVAHLAGIQREIGPQTFRAVHQDATLNLVLAARRQGVEKLVLLSFLKARPNCGSAYHESKWRAEEMVRDSGLDYTILKAGVVYGRGDHLLDHLSRSLHTFPIFPQVGWEDRPARPLLVHDLVRILMAALVQGRLPKQTMPVTGPEELPFTDVVRRVGEAIGIQPRCFPLPVAVHYALAWLWERLMVVPLVSLAQVRMLWEGLTSDEPAQELPEDLRPSSPFSLEHIRSELPEPGPFQVRDFRLPRCCSRSSL